MFASDVSRSVHGYNADGVLPMHTRAGRPGALEKGELVSSPRLATRGRALADIVMKALARFVRRYARASDVCTRAGGPGPGQAGAGGRPRRAKGDVTSGKFRPGRARDESPARGYVARSKQLPEGRQVPVFGEAHGWVTIGTRSSHGLRTENLITGSSWTGRCPDSNRLPRNHYGRGVFEGARLLRTVNGPACLPLDAPYAG